MQQVDRGNLDLARPIGEYLANVDEVHLGWRGITLLQLLSRTGGLAANPPFCQFRKWRDLDSAIGRRRVLEEDPMMNMPPEPNDPALVARMAAGVSDIAANLVPLLRYQPVRGSAADRDIAQGWMQANGLEYAPDRFAITPGTHASLYAILMQLSEPGQVLLCETLTYPGIRAIAARLDLRLVGVASDQDGMCPQALEQAGEQFTLERYQRS